MDEKLLVQNQIKFFYFINKAEKPKIKTNWYNWIYCYCCC